ncbi:alpha/beta hydrolase [Peribacillus sp. NPDC097295]|uniref:alpha/beta hydrolase n=1 Tax=Peribacillus sp. NPDC097295 TaxID=3364402 RepID=UPI0037F3ED3F
MEKEKYKESVADHYREDKEVVLKGTSQFLMKSSMEGRMYQIFIYRPREPEPAEGYPVIYILDANSVFGTIVEAMRLQSKKPEKTGIVPAVIVGIGYPIEGPFSDARYYDFTLPVDYSELPKKPGGGEWPAHGGAENFLHFIEEDLKPKIMSSIPINRDSQTILGHSLGGLFTLYTLYRNPDAFQTYIAGSPSIHWNKKWFSEEENQFLKRLESKDRDISLFVGVGEFEKKHKSGMNENALEFTDRLRNIAKRQLCVKFKEFDEENHVSVLPPLINKGLRFALRANGPVKE